MMRMMDVMEAIGEMESWSLVRNLYGKTLGNAPSLPSLQPRPIPMGPGMRFDVKGVIIIELPNASAPPSTDIASSPRSRRHRADGLERAIAGGDRCVASPDFGKTRRRCRRGKRGLRFPSCRQQRPQYVASSAAVARPCRCPAGRHLRSDLGGGGERPADHRPAFIRQPGRGLLHVPALQRRAGACLAPRCRFA